MALSRNLALEKAVDLSQDRVANEKLRNERKSYLV
jgi:hypothetical protein